GVPGVAPARVVVIGGGSAGTNAALVASGMGADVTILDINVARLRQIDDVHRGRMKTIRSSIAAIDDFVSRADLVIGAVLVPGARAPVVVTEDNIRAMKPGSVIVDISIDQGGCIETARETSHTEPTYVLHDVVHYAVGNIPGAVPNTATYALTNVTMPYAVALADGLEGATARFPELIPGINVANYKITNETVAVSLGVDFVDPGELLSLG
ncbi:MAG TPA: alanine dehydrogenase, partial [Actinobacteria bacterium]|nr:alanine dehydrogenase [Actinomycetota bacterium]